MPSLSDLVKLAVKDEILDAFITLLRLGNFPVASWHSGSIQKHLIEDESSLYVDVSTSIQKIAKSGLIKYAAEVDDAWVDLVAENVFGEARKPAIFTQGTAIVTDTAGIGPVTINPGSFWVGNDDKTLRFVNIDVAPKILPLNGSIDLTVQAETAGTKWNVGVNGITEILTPQPGLVVTNLALASGTWITQQGADVESNPALVQRCLDKWAILGSGSNEGAYRYRAASASSEITRVKVFSPGGGSVRVVIGGDAGPVSSTALNLAAAIIERARPLGVPDVTTENLIVATKVISGTLYVRAGRDPVAAGSAAKGGVDALQRATIIGSKVSREQIIKALLADDIEDLDLSLPATDFQLLTNEIWVPSYALVTG